MEYREMLSTGKTVNKESFLLLAENYASLSEDDGKKLIALQRQYPYSQIVRSLATRAAQDNKLDVQQNHLHTCAVYSTDRTILKSIMTALPQIKEAEVHIVPKLNVSPDVLKLPVHDHELHGDDLLDEVLNDLKTLKKLKHNFEISLEKFEKRQEQQAAVPETDIFIEEIKTTRKKIKTDDIKQKEQIEIIDQFIKTQPSIKANTKPAADTKDLSESSLSHNDRFVSETLVEILMKQGKKEKAVEVLKKLIWKFPQKKAYFAARIEELRQ